MHQPSLFQSFLQGGFECSTHRRSDGRRLDLLAATGHVRWAEHDYAALREYGLTTVRDGLRWHRIERTPGRFDWSSLRAQLRAARRQRTQVIWDLCHYGWPDDISIWRPHFVERFARYAAAVAQLVKDETDAVPFYTPINEISFWSWAGGDVAYFNPTERGRGFELKHQLVRATLAAMDAIRGVEPRARFVQVDPAIHIASISDDPHVQGEVHRSRQAQFEAWDMLCGERWPGLGGAPEYLDIVGVNFYAGNQWVHEDGRIIGRDSPHYRPFSEMLGEVGTRYRRPVLIAETGAEGDARSSWLRYVCDEAWHAMEGGAPIEGICLYPVLDYPGWTDDRHCPAGLLGFPDEQGRRPADRRLAAELRLQRERFRPPVASSATRRSPEARRLPDLPLEG